MFCVVQWYEIADVKDQEVMVRLPVKIHTNTSVGTGTNLKKEKKKRYL